jgi:hypothetical protein
LAGALDTLTADRVLEGGVDDKTEFCDRLSDLAATCGPFLRPVKMGLSREEQLAQCLAGPMLLTGCDNRGPDHV